jgi:type I restriction enzyme S subunit
MKEGWFTCTIGDICIFNYGSGLSEKKRRSGEIPVYGSNGIIGYHDEALVHEPGIIIGRKGTLGKVFFSRVPFYPIDTTFYITTGKDYHLQFLYYLLRTLGFEKKSTDSAVPGLNRELAYGTPILLPPLSIQHRIAEILRALDDKIECNRQINKILEQMAMALYKHSFMDSNSSETRPLTDFIDIDPPIHIPNGKSVPYADMKALPTGSMSVTDVIRRPFTSGSKFQNNDTLFARITPCLENGKTAFVDFLEKDEAGFGSTEFIVLRAKQGISPQFVYCCARNENLRSHAIKSMVGSSGRQRVRTDCFNQFRIKKFGDEIMRDFHEKTDIWFKRIRANVKENQTLAHTRNYLLPKLLSGEIEVKLAEEQVSGVV